MCNLEVPGPTGPRSSNVSLTPQPSSRPDTSIAPTCHCMCTAQEARSTGEAHSSCLHVQSCWASSPSLLRGLSRGARWCFKPSRPLTSCSFPAENPWPVQVSAAERETACPSLQFARPFVWPIRVGDCRFKPALPAVHLPMWLIAVHARQSHARQSHVRLVKFNNQWLYISKYLAMPHGQPGISILLFAVLFSAAGNVSEAEKHPCQQPEGAEWPTLSADAPELEVSSGSCQQGSRATGEEGESQWTTHLRTPRWQSHSWGSCPC